MKARILVVDSWSVLSSILRTHRYQPIWTADGIQTCVRPEGPASRHLVGSRSAGGDGFVVLKRLKRHRLLSAIPVIVVTGQDSTVAV